MVNNFCEKNLEQLNLNQSQTLIKSQTQFPAISWNKCSNNSLFYFHYLCLLLFIYLSFFLFTFSFVYLFIIYTGIKCTKHLQYFKDLLCSLKTLVKVASCHPYLSLLILHAPLCREKLHEQ
jgi:hypothetical protein